MTTNHLDYFDNTFKELTGNAPFGWQKRLFVDYFQNGEVPAALDIPTGLGKTLVMAIWLIALACQAGNGGLKLPRRLVYVVDRRTVVDQATDVAEQVRSVLKTAAAESIAADVRERLSKLCIDPTDDASPLAISTLRGKRADNRQWQADPAQPTIIVGTVDMIGSRLLFSGYGVSRRMQPFHAGLLGQDTLLIHDEAHLSEPFGKLIHSIAKFQKEQKAPRPLHIMELSATQRGAESDVFALSDAEKSEAEVAKRLHAEKRLHFDGAAEDKEAIAKVVKLALRYKDERKRMLVYVRRPADARDIADRIAKATTTDRVALLTGTIRGYERDALAETSLFKGFRSDPGRALPAATEYLVATSAGEVGIDLDADHLVCDLTTLDSMIQRLGRVNRLGGREAEVHVVEWPKETRKGAKKKDEEKTAKDTQGGQTKGGEGSELDKRIAATKAALVSLTKRDNAYDASPESLRTLAARTDAFAPSPRTVELTDILIDNWALTRVKDLPGRPMPERWLHGVEAGEPDLFVAWREEVEVLASCPRSEDHNSIRILKQLYDKHAILAHERLRGPLSEVTKELGELAETKSKSGEASEGDSETPATSTSIFAILLPVNGDPDIGALSELVKRTSELPNATIVLPPGAGGLNANGMLAGKGSSGQEPRYDVADDLAAGSNEQRRRLRILIERRDDEGWSARVLGQVTKIEIESDLAERLAEAPSDKVPNRLLVDHFAKHNGLTERALLVLEQDEEGPTKVLQLLSPTRAAAIYQDDPAAAARKQDLDEHLRWAEEEAERLVERTGLKAHNADIAEAVVIAARWHDRGKNRPAWQKAIGNPPPRKGANSTWKPWAKSGQRGFAETASGPYRHEFGSLREASGDDAILKHPERDLILHLIAAHHGWARPHFRPDQWDIADGVTEEENAAVATETLRRFARLQRRFGHWGLAWLEALVRAADYAASERLAASTEARPSAPNVAPSPVSVAPTEDTP